MKSKYKLTLIALIILFTVCLGFNAYFSIPYYKANNVKFQNLDNLQLSARYLPTENGKGVIIAADLSHDKSELTSLVYELSRLGYGVYVFDFPSQGGSEGNIPFHHNDNDYLAEQFYCAMVAYSQLADMKEENIHIIGYGSGARAVLQTASLGFIHPASITLIGTDINLSNKVQFNVLNFSKDTEIEWIKNLNKYTGGCPIHLIYSKFDNISTVADNELLAQSLQSDPASTPQVLQLNSITSTKTGLSVHYMLMNNTFIAQSAVSRIAVTDQMNYVPENLLKFRLIAVIAMFCVLLGICQLLSIGLKPHIKDIAINNKIPPEKFFRYKLMLWAPTLIVFAVLPIALYLIPINFPYNDIFRLTLFSSYGIIMFIIYKFTNFGNDMGKNFFANDGLKNLRGALLTGLIMIGALVLISYSGLYYLFSFHSKWLWLILFTALCMLIFFIDEKERKILSLSFREKILLMFINYMGILIAPIILIALGLYNTAFMMFLMIGCLALVLSLDLIFYRINSPIRTNALIKAFIFQLLVFAQSTMFFN